MSVAVQLIKQTGSAAGEQRMALQLLVLWQRPGGDFLGDEVGQPARSQGERVAVRAQQGLTSCVTRRVSRSLARKTGSCKIPRGGALLRDENTGEDNGTKSVKPRENRIGDSNLRKRRTRKLHEDSEKNCECLRMFACDLLGAVRL